MGQIEFPSEPNWQPLRLLVPDEKLRSEFMFMGTYLAAEDEGAARIELYKHQSSRRYLNVDAEGNCYVYDGAKRGARRKPLSENQSPRGSLQFCCFGRGQSLVGYQLSFMFSRERIEHFDASRGIPRKANEQYLPAYQAFWAWAGDVGCGFIFSYFGRRGRGFELVRRIFARRFRAYLARLLVARHSFLRCRFDGRISFVLVVSAADDEYVARLGALGEFERLNRQKIGQSNQSRAAPEKRFAAGESFRRARFVFAQRTMAAAFRYVRSDGFGKIENFFYADDSRDFEKLVRFGLRPERRAFRADRRLRAREIYRLDLNNPEQSDRWNFIPHCRENPAFACQIAGMMLGAENRHKTSQDPFWGEAEQLALTAILLHLAFVYEEKAIPAFAADFLIGVGGKEDAFAAALETSPSFFAKQAFFAFRR